MHGGHFDLRKSYMIYTHLYTKENTVKLTDFYMGIIVTEHSYIEGTLS